MNYTYEFITIEPKRLFLQIKFSTEGKPDIWKNLITKDFSEEGLNILAKSQLPSVIAQWQNYDSAPETIELSNPVVSSVYKPEITEQKPQYDEWTQKLIEVVTETDTEIVRSWEIVDLTQEERDAVRASWRLIASISNRQARLALKQENLLGQVNAAIASLPEPEKSIVETEWEYAATVERKSPWIATLAPALNMSEEDMDNLFKLAATL